MNTKQKITRNIVVLLFFTICVSQWFFTQREDWPFSYFGMYKGRIYPNHIYSYKLWGETWDDKTIDIYSLGSFNGFAFIDKTEEIILDKKISPTNEVLSIANSINLDKNRLGQLIELSRSDLEPYLNRIKAQQKIKSFRFEIKYWSLFTWERRLNPDLQSNLINAYYENNSWHYTSRP